MEQFNSGRRNERQDIVNENPSILTNSILELIANAIKGEISAKYEITKDLIFFLEFIFENELNDDPQIPSEFLNLRKDIRDKYEPYLRVFLSI